MKLNSPTVIIIAVIAVIMLGILATTVGNVSIRRVQSGSALDIAISQPVVPGVETAVRWAAPADSQERTIHLWLKASEYEGLLGQGTLGDGTMNIKFPCDELGRVGTISITDATTGQVLAWQGVQILEPGPDCLQ